MKADIEALEERVRDRLIRKAERGGLTLYNYTDLAQYDRKWDAYTVQARGLIVDGQGEIVAWPFPKFFNLGEPSCPPLPDLPYQVFEKIDGSLGIWYWHAGAWQVATRGSFENVFTQYAGQFAGRLEPYRRNWTVLTEISMPPALDELPRAVRHAPGLYVLGAVDRETGQDIDPEEVAAGWSGEGPQRFQETVDNLLAKVEADAGTEGWVVRYANGLRVKIKTAWYLRLFRAFNDLSEKRIKELVLAAGLGNDRWLADFPEEVRADAEAIYATIMQRHRERSEAIRADFERLRHPDRKTFALSIKDHPERPFLFLLYDGRDIAAKLLEAV